MCGPYDNGGHTPGAVFEPTSEPNSPLDNRMDPKTIKITVECKIHTEVYVDVPTTVFGGTGIHEEPPEAHIPK